MTQNHMIDCDPGNHSMSPLCPVQSSESEWEAEKYETNLHEGVRVWLKWNGEYEGKRYVDIALTELEKLCELKGKQAILTILDLGNGLGITLCDEDTQKGNGAKVLLDEDLETTIANLI
ncbi:hypothetical protein [Xanthovirga aplysinae]|uniref:hypothetical protein n=1 Tax=Xanthovirga aplysinae TaxID=2529853 RepID=UPI0012BC5F9B|nr:hypothetical protein [Xanthovirga aplysinae]MTI30207.1 hypothetical protein [Xanthovirga aplysinae]